MTSPRLSSLKIRLDHLLMVVGGVVVVTVALLSWRALRSDVAEVESQSGAAELDSGLEQLRENKKGGRHDTQTPRFVRSFHSSARRETGEGRFIPPPPPQLDPGDLGPDEAIDTFKQVLGELEAAAESERRLTEREEAELYNRATGSFTAFSAWVDTGNASERALMDEAYLQMTSLMRELDLEAPRHDTDPPLVQR